MDKVWMIMLILLASAPAWMLALLPIIDPH